jgi:hypothetical protein
MNSEEKIEKLESEIKDLKRENRIMNQKLTNQALLLISLGKKVMKLDGIVREDSPFKKKEPVSENWSPR